MAEQNWKRLERRAAEGFSRFLSGGKCVRVLSRESLMGRMIECKYGDLAIHPDCPEQWLPSARWFMENVMVDAKRRKTFSLEMVLRSRAHPFWLWQKKLREDAGQKIALMVVTSPGGRGLLSYDVASAARLSESFGSIYIPSVVLTAFGKQATFVAFDAWLSAVGSPQALGCPA